MWLCGWLTDLPIGRDCNMSAVESRSLQILIASWCQQHVQKKKHKVPKVSQQNTTWLKQFETNEPMMANLHPKSGSTKPQSQKTLRWTNVLCRITSSWILENANPFVQLWFATNGTNTNPTSGMTFLQSPETRFGPHVTRPRKFMRIILPPSPSFVFQKNLDVLSPKLLQYLFASVYQVQASSHQPGRVPEATTISGKVLDRDLRHFARVGGLVCHDTVAHLEDS